MSFRLLRIFIIFVSYLVLFFIAKLIFVVANNDVYSPIGVSEIFAILRHGYMMDQSMASYLTALPALLILGSIWTGRSNWLETALAVWRYFTVFVIVMVVALDSVLYGYWQFKLDTTPIFYFISSPSSAMASVNTWIIVISCVGIIAVSIGLGYAMGFLWRFPRLPYIKGIRSRWLSSAVMALALGALFVGIRGGLTVSTMNPSAAYFSTDVKMNHAAVNPLFSLMYSAMHSSDFSRQFRYFDNAELQLNLLKLDEAIDPTLGNDTLKLREGVEYPDIYIIILESFSIHLMPMFGGEPVAIKVDSIAREGITFVNFYASSFRTDRAIPAILSGYPAQPSTSIMKFVDKVEKLPSIAASLSEQAGYDCRYYYGGDINFVNQKAYLVSSNFSKIVSDEDFPLSLRMSKWGVHDDQLWNKVWADIAADTSSGKNFTVVQTSSSHEPFDVPYHSRRFTNQRAVAFEYADSCVGAFVDSLAASPKWANSLLILVPDHWGAYPQGLTDPVARHRIPLIFTGGALAAESSEKKIATVGVQTDIAATLLGLLNLNYDDFVMSKNMLDASSAHYAFFSEPDFAVIVSPADTTVISTREDRVISGKEKNSKKVKAFLQKLYNDLDSR